ncbi:MAG: hypothetical protein HY474_01545 [Candidatus Sungbacteria bacterium]|uniref:Uncharacterized protein n=1 Tax=Candidatus Sungiibacteriota bacterium TaxID=2750080 RepID=A0A932YY19_9BACT|nr:hypothetical protein [Candidatus Sungbacteria bacterium]
MALTRLTAGERRRIAQRGGSPPGRVLLPAATHKKRERLTLVNAAIAAAIALGLWALLGRFGSVSGGWLWYRLAEVLLPPV